MPERAKAGIRIPQAHVIGAGIAGLACGVELQRRGWRVSLYEAAPQAGGRCRTFHDAQLDRAIDNGNHLLLSANTAALDYVQAIGARDQLHEVAPAHFPFVDVETGQRWSLDPSSGPIPWWIFSASRRIPGTAPWDYLESFRLARAGPDATVADCLKSNSPLWRCFWEPLALAVLNTAPEEASAALLWHAIRESFLKGEAACRPLVAVNGLGPAFVDPALALLRRNGVSVQTNTRLRSLRFEGFEVAALEVGDMEILLGSDDAVVLAVSPSAAAELLPGLTVPTDTRPIVNAHIRLPASTCSPASAADKAPFIGLLGGTAQWLFLRGDVASLTVSGATDLVELPNEEIAARLWRDTAKALNLPQNPRPPVRIIKEKRATIAQTPAMLRDRPAVRTRWRNLLLAGDWIDTGYPASIESAVRSAAMTCAALGNPFETSN